MTNKTANIKATVNGIVFENLTIEQAQALANVSTNASVDTVKAEQAKAKAEQAKAKKAAKVEQVKTKHDAILDTKRVERMVKTATDKAKAQGFELKPSKQGKWVWLYPNGGQGRTPEFKALKLAKGWKYSPKRGAFYRDFS